MVVYALPRGRTLAQSEPVLADHRRQAPDVGYVVVRADDARAWLERNPGAPTEALRQALVAPDHVVARYDVPGDTVPLVVLQLLRDARRTSR